MLHTSHDFSRLLKSICSVTSLRPAAVRADVKVCLPFAKLKRNSLKFIKQGCDVFSAVSDGSVNNFFFLLCSHHPFVFLWQCSRTQYAKCTDFKQWTASGCLCGNKWRSALCRSVSPNSCSRCTFRRT